MPAILNRQTIIAQTKIFDIPPGGMKVTHKDVYNMEAIYFFLHEWFVEYEWAEVPEDKWPEVLYVQREGAAGIELWIKWRFKKNRPDPWFKWELDMDWHVLGMKDVDAVVKGRKMKLQTAEVEIQFYPRLMQNPDFVKSDLYNKVKRFMLKRFLKKKVDTEETHLYNEAMRLQEAIKGYFRIDLYLEEPAFERFYATRTGEEPRGEGR